MQKLYRKIIQRWDLWGIILLFFFGIFFILYLTRPGFLRFLPKYSWAPVSFFLGLFSGIFAHRIFTFLWKRLPDRKLQITFLAVLLASGWIISNRLPLDVHRTRLSQVKLDIVANITLGNQNAIIKNITVDGQNIPWFDDCLFTGKVNVEYSSIRLGYDLIETPGKIDCSLFPKNSDSDIAITFENQEHVQGVDFFLEGRSAKTPALRVDEGNGVSVIFDTPTSKAFIIGRLSFVWMGISVGLLIACLLYGLMTIPIPSLRTALWLLYGFFLLLWYPAIWYSLNTRFSLIDDYNSFYFVHILKSCNFFYNYLKNAIFSYTPGRYRPMFEIYNAITWKWFGEDFTLHHLARLVLLAVIVLLSIKILRLLIFKENRYSYLSVLVFTGIFLFYPNHPEARLAPQETLLVFFYTIVLYGYVIVFRKHHGDILVNKYAYALILTGFIGMHLSKEPSVFLSVVFIIFSFICDSKRWRHFLAYLPLWIIFGHTLTKILYMSQHPKLYGVSQVTLRLVYANTVGLINKIFLLKAVKVLPLIMLLWILASIALLFYRVYGAKSPLRQIKGHKLVLTDYLHFDPVLAWLGFLLISLIASFMSLIVLQGNDLRYYYPFLYLLALFLSLGMSSTDLLSPIWRRILARSAWVGILIFVTANYYNFMYQFATQYYHRLMESQVLEHTESLLKSGETVYIKIDAEYEYKIRDYFTGYLPRYQNLKYTNIFFVEDEQIACPTEPSIHYITRKLFVPELAGYTLTTRITLPSRSRFFEKLEEFAAYLGPDDEAFFDVDGGAATMGTVGWQDYLYLGQPCPQP